MTAALLSAALLAAAAPNGGADPLLVVQLGGLLSTEGMVRVAVFDDPAPFPEEIGLAACTVSVRPEGAMVEVEVPGLTPGTYAVAAFHDEDGDRVVDRNIFGVPLEPFGFTMGARARLGPPRFEEARFDLDGDTTYVSVFLD